MRYSVAMMGLLVLSIGCGKTEDPKRGTYTDTSDPSKINVQDLMKPAVPPGVSPSGS